MSFNFKIFAVGATLIASTVSFLHAADSRAVSFNNDWEFKLGNDTIGGSWRTLNLPHDWAIEGDFSEKNPSGTGGGALPGGIGWYKKDFKVPETDKDKELYIDFDGAYMNSTVWINGHELGTRPYGYSSFSYDLTPYIKFGADNSILVKVDNEEQPNSRWYSGCGIYRNVWLRTLNPTHVKLWGTYVTTPEVSKENATVKVETTLSIGNNKVVPEVKTSIINSQGIKVASSEKKPVNLTDSTVTQTLDIPDPCLWAVGNPCLYKAISEVYEGDVLVDTYETPFGVRYFNFDAEKGFSLNGEPMKIHGVCLHHDAGALGAVVNKRAIERQLEILRGMGINAIRSSHNPPAPELLELTDSMGFIVMDETFDMWRKRKTPHDYARYFDDWHEKDLTELIIRDRNHPSIMMWSIGNEVLEQWSDASADTLSLEEANMILNFGHSSDMLAAEGDISVNSLLTQKLADMVRKLDPTRPITAGNNEPSPGNHLFRSDALDIIGYNYHDEWFKDVPTNFPGKPFIITESVSALQTRGYYTNPSDSIILAPERWDKPYFDPSFAASAYDNMRAPWGDHHESALQQVLDNDFISGQFVWTGFDYIGEPTPYGWPARSSYFGIVDLAGFPKDVYYMYKAELMPQETVLYIFPHWNWNEGETVDIWAYYNNAEEVELFLNGESLGKKAKGGEKNPYHVMWRVPFQPGTIEALSYDADGNVVAKNSRTTASSPRNIILTPDRDLINAGNNDLSYITIEVTDENGNLNPVADNDIKFNVTGGGFIAGVDNGSPTSLERFKDDHRKLFNGKALLIVQTDGSSQPIIIEAFAEGLNQAKTIIQKKK
ncbi:MAG: DUF4982 domain-containing protein [Muribaculaceae bacterium]|nr:DUF4982 domain-containing protein [Muribaculaceae bacterium]